MKKTIQLIRSKWREYLIEIAVIILGILLAFGLNNWHLNNQEKKEEQIILQNLVLDLKNDMVQLDTSSALLASLIKNIRHLLDPSFITSTNADELVEFRRRHTVSKVFTGFRLNNKNYRSIINEGKTALITDRNLWAAITTYYENDQEYYHLVLDWDAEEWIFATRQMNLLAEHERSGEFLQRKSIRDQKLVEFYQSVLYRNFKKSDLSRKNRLLKMNKELQQKTKTLINKIEVYLSQY